METLPQDTADTLFTAEWRKVRDTPEYAAANNTGRLFMFKNWAKGSKDLLSQQLQEAPEQSRPEMEKKLSELNSFINKRDDLLSNKYDLGYRVQKAGEKSNADLLDVLRDTKQLKAEGFDPGDIYKLRKAVTDELAPVLLRSGSYGLNFATRFGPLVSLAKEQLPGVYESALKQAEVDLWEKPGAFEGAVNSLKDIVSSIAPSLIGQAIVKGTGGLIQATSSALKSSSSLFYKESLGTDKLPDPRGDDFDAPTVYSESPAVSSFFKAGEDAGKAVGAAGNKIYGGQDSLFTSDPRYGKWQSVVTGAAAQMPGQLGLAAIPVAGPALSMASNTGMMYAENVDQYEKDIKQTLFDEGKKSGSIPETTSFKSWEKNLSQKDLDEVRAKAAGVAFPVAIGQGFIEKQALGSLLSDATLKFLPAPAKAALMRLRYTNPRAAFAARILTNAGIKSPFEGAEESAQGIAKNLGSAILTGDFAIDKILKNTGEDFVGGLGGGVTATALTLNQVVKTEKSIDWAQSILNGRNDAIQNDLEVIDGSNKPQESPETPQVSEEEKTKARERLGRLNEEELRHQQDIRIVEAPDADKESFEFREAQRRAQNRRDAANWMIRQVGGTPEDSVSADRYEKTAEADREYQTALTKHIQENLPDYKPPLQEFQRQAQETRARFEQLRRDARANGFTQVAEAADAAEKLELERLAANALNTTETAGKLTEDFIGSVETEGPGRAKFARQQLARLYPNSQFSSWWDDDATVVEILNARENKEIDDKTNLDEWLSSPAGIKATTPDSEAGSKTPTKPEGLMTTGQRRDAIKEANFNFRKASPEAQAKVNELVDDIRFWEAILNDKDSNEQDKAEAMERLPDLEDALLELATAPVEAKGLNQTTANDQNQTPNQTPVPSQEVSPTSATSQGTGAGEPFTIVRTMGGEEIIQTERDYINESRGIVKALTGGQMTPEEALQNVDAVRQEIEAAPDLTPEQKAQWASHFQNIPALAEQQRAQQATPNASTASAAASGVSESTGSPELIAGKGSLFNQPTPARLNGVSGDVFRTESGEVVFRSTADNTETVLRVKEDSIEKDPATLTAEDFEGGDGTPLVSEANKQFSVLSNNDRPVRPFFRSEPQSTITPQDGQTVKSTGSYPVDAGSTPAPATSAIDTAAITAGVQANPDIHRLKDGNRKLVSREAAVAILTQLPQTFTNKDVAALAKDSGMTSPNLRKLAALRGDQNAVASILNGDMDAELGLFDDVILKMRQERAATKAPLNETTPPTTKVSNDTSVKPVDTTPVAETTGQGTVDRFVFNLMGAFNEALSKMNESNLKVMAFRAQMQTAEGRAEIQRKLAGMAQTSIFAGIRSKGILDPVVEQEMAEKALYGTVSSANTGELTKNVQQDLLNNLAKTGDPFLTTNKDGDTVSYNAWFARGMNLIDRYIKAQNKRDKGTKNSEGEQDATDVENVDAQEIAGALGSENEADPEKAFKREQFAKMKADAIRDTYDKIALQIAKESGYDLADARLALLHYIEKKRGVKVGSVSLGWKTEDDNSRVKQSLLKAIEPKAPQIFENLGVEMRKTLASVLRAAEEQDLLSAPVIDLNNLTLESLIEASVYDEIVNGQSHKNAIAEAREKNSTSPLMPLLAKIDRKDVVAAVHSVLNNGKPFANARDITALTQSDMQKVLDSGLLPARIQETLQALVDLSGDGMALLQNSKNEGWRRWSELLGEQMGNRAPVQVVFNLALDPAVTGQGLWQESTNTVHVSPFLTREQGLMESTLLHEMMHPVWDWKVTAFQRGDLSQLNKKEVAALTELQDLLGLVKAEADKKLAGITDKAALEIAKRDLLGSTDLREFLNEAINHKPFQDFLAELKDPDAKGKGSLFRRIVNAILKLIRGGDVAEDSILQRSFELSLDLANYTDRELPIAERNKTQVEYFKKLEAAMGRPLTLAEAERAATDFAFKYPQSRIANTRAEASRLAPQVLTAPELDGFNEYQRNSSESVLASQMVTPAQEVYEAIKANGGITVDVWTGSQPSSGIVVAPFKETETKFSLNEFTSEDVKEYMRKFQPLLEVSGMHLGGWVSDDTIYLDVSVVTDDEVTATTLAQDGNQLATFNLGNFTQLDTPDLLAKHGGAVSRLRAEPRYQNLRRALQQALGRAMGSIRGTDSPDVSGQGDVQERTSPELSVIEALTGEQPTAEEAAEILESAPTPTYYETLSNKGNDPVTGSRTAIGRAVKRGNRAGRDQASGNEGPLVRGSDFPDEVRRGDRETHQELERARSGINEALGGSLSFQSVELLKQLTGKATAPEGSELAQTIDSLRSKIPVLPNNVLQGLKQLSEGMSSKVFVDTKNDSAYKLLSVSDKGSVGGTFPQDIRIRAADDTVVIASEKNPSLLEFLRAVAISNVQGSAVFTEVAGVTEDGDVILKQPYIKGLTPTDNFEDPEGFREALRDLGLSMLSDIGAVSAVGKVGNRYALFDDLHGENVMRDKNGRAQLVDALATRLLSNDEYTSVAPYLKDPEVLASVAVPREAVMDKALGNVLTNAVAEPAQAAFLKPEEFTKAREVLNRILSNPEKVKARGNRTVNLNSPDDSTARKLEKATGRRWDGARQMLEARVIHALTEEDRQTPNANKIATAPMIPQTLRQADFIARNDFEGRPFLVFAKLYTDPDSPTGVRWHFVEAREDTGAFETQYSDTDPKRGRALAASVIGIGDSTPKKKKALTEAGYAQGQAGGNIPAGSQGIEPDVSFNQGEVLDNTNVESVQNKILAEVDILTEKLNRLVASSDYTGAGKVQEQLDELTKQFDSLGVKQSASVLEQLGTPEERAIDVVEAAARSFANKARYLTASERGKLRSNTRETFVRIFNDLPSEKEFAAAAIGGQAKRGWYRASSQAIIEVFGADAPRFAALLAATSPQTSVENNLINALNIWKNWTAAGRPTDRKAILKVMGQSVMGNKGEDSVLDAWVNNSTRALTSENPEALVISGPKVNSFMLNLRGFVDEVTNDAWMANFALVDQVIFKGSLNAAGTDPGKGPGYLAMSARVRAAASYLTKLTGEEWTPAEVQETVWSWAKTLYELQERQGENRTALEILQAGELTDDAIANTPDFATLLNNGTYKQILKEAGYGEALERLAQSDTGSTGETQRRFEPEAGSAIGKTIRTLQERSAQRLTQLYTQRQEEAARKAAIAKQATEQNEVKQSALVPASTSKQDADYLAAVERGDMETAQKMVDEAAERAGFSQEGWHGSNAKDPFTVFNTDNTIATGWRGLGAFFGSKSQAESFSSTAQKFYLKLNNTLETTYSDIMDRFDDPSEARRQVVAEGYDSISLDPYAGAVAVFSPSQIKSAEPVTRDDAGNVIPLSQRFQQDTPDIRYSAPVPFQGNVTPGFRQTTAFTRVLNDPEYQGIRNALGGKQYISYTVDETLSKAEEFLNLPVHNGDLKTAFYAAGNATGITAEQVVMTKALAIQRAQKAANNARASSGDTALPAHTRNSMDTLARHYQDLADEFADDLMSQASLAGQELRAFRMLADTLSPYSWVRKYKQPIVHTQKLKMDNDPVFKEMLERIKAARRDAANSTTTRMQKALAIAAKRFVKDTSVEEVGAYEKFARLLASNLSVREEVMQAATEMAVVSGMEAIRKAVAPGDKADPAFLKQWEDKLRSIASEQLNGIIESRLQGGMVDAEASPELTEEQKMAAREQKIMDAWRDFSDFPLAEMVFNLARSTIVASDSPYAALVRKAQFDPAKIKRLQQAVKMSINTAEEIRKSVADRNMSVESLILRLQETNPSLSETEVGALAEAVKAVYDDEVQRASAAALQTIVNSSKRDPRKLTDAATISKLLPLVNMGAFKEEEVYNVLAEKFGLPTWSQENAEKIEAMANRVQALPEGSIERGETGQQMMLEILRANIKDSRGATRLQHMNQIASAIWTAGILSGPPTQIVNAAGTGLSVFLESFMDATGHFVEAKRRGVSTAQASEYYKDIARAWLFAFGKDANKTSLRAINEVHTALTRGASKFKSEKQEDLSTLELFKFDPRVAIPGNALMGAITTGEWKQALPQAGELGLGILRTVSERVVNRDAKGALKDYLATLKMVGRGMLATDAVNSFAATAAKEMMIKRTLMQTEGLTDAEVNRQMKEIRKGGEESVVAAAKAQAEQEATEGSFGPAGSPDHNIRKARRVEQLIEQMTYGNSVMEQGRDFAANATFNSEAYGLIGATMMTVFGNMNRYAGVVAKPINPFPKTVSNLLNTSLNYTLYGYARAMGWNMGSRWINEDSKYFRAAPDRGSAEFYAAHAKATAGTLALGALAMMLAQALKDREEKKEPFFEVHGPGPKDPKLRAQWAQSGHKPFTVRIGSLELRYTDWPGINIPLGMLGTIYDNLVHTNKEADVLDQLFIGVASVLGTTLDRNMLGGATALFDLMSKNTYDGAKEAALGKLVSSYTGGFLKPSFVRYLETVATGEYQDARSMRGWFLSQIPVVGALANNPAINVLGEPIKVSAWDATAGRLVSLSDTHPILSPLTTADLVIPQPQAYKIYDPSKPTMVRPMSAQEEYEYAATYGKIMNERLTPELVQSLTEQAKFAPQGAQDVLTNIATGVRNQAQGELAAKRLIQKGKERKGP